ncbi:hypothetical protein [Catellatospora methionotrophica]|uniref:hypothetical protein n=1 Tax=Catellatospora methionotrophica TaxID=121620 RepID=UPI0033DDF05E
MITDGVVDGAVRFRQRLLPQTLQHGGEIEFYRRHWADVPASRRHSLVDLPTVSKQKNLSELEAMRHPRLRPALLTQTTGTTGRPFRLYRSGEELEAYREYVQALMAKARRTGAEARPVLAFNALPQYVHGASIDANQIAYRFAIDVESEIGLQNALSLLSDTTVFCHDGIAPMRVVSGSPQMLLSLTAACDLSGVDPAALKIDELYSLGDVLTSSTRRHLARRWPDSKIHDVFSCAEVIGAAAVCAHCGGLHYEPVVLPEILDLDVDESSRGNVGELTLTELYPFAQLQPLLRYRTGDIVRRVDCPARPDDLAFVPLGRRHSCPTVTVDGTSHILIGGIMLREVMEEEPGVARERLAEVLHPVIGQLPGGGARVAWDLQMADRAARLRLAVAASFSPGLFPDSALELRDRLTRRLRELISVPDGLALEIELGLHEPHSNVEALCVRPLLFPAPEVDFASGDA